MAGSKDGRASSSDEMVGESALRMLPEALHAQVGSVYLPRPAMDVPCTWRRPRVDLAATRPLERRPQAQAGGRAPSAQVEVKSAAGLRISQPADTAGPQEVHPRSMPCGTRATHQPRSPHIPRPRCEGRDAGDDRESRAPPAW